MVHLKICIFSGFELIGGHVLKVTFPSGWSCRWGSCDGVLRRMDGNYGKSCVVMANSWWIVDCAARRTGNLPSQWRFLCFHGYGATPAKLPSWSTRCRGETRIGSSCPERSVIGLWRRVPPPEGAPLAERGWNAVPAEFHKHAGTFCLFAMTNSSFNRANKTEHTCKRVN